MGEFLGSESPRVHFLQFPLQLGDSLPGANSTSKRPTKAQNFGGEPLVKLSTCSPSSSCLNGELADAQGGMGPDFQSVADRSDRRRMRI